MSKFEEYCEVDGKAVRKMCIERGTSAAKIAKEIGCSTGWLYGRLKEGRMPVNMAHKMMDAIYDGCPPFYWESRNSNSASTQMVIYPSYYSDLIQARTYLNIALRKMEEIEQNHG